MARCPYIYVVNEVQRPCIHDENDPHRHALSNYPWQQYGNPAKWKLPHDFKGTALTPVILREGVSLPSYMSRLHHVHGQAGTCIKSRFTSTKYCPVVAEKTDSEEEPCDYEYHLLSNSGKVEKYPCVGKLGHEEQHRYVTGGGIKRVGSIRSAWHKKPTSYHAACPEKTETEPEKVETRYRVVIATNDLGTVREIKRGVASLDEVPNRMQDMIRRQADLGAHILNVRVEARTVTTTAWEALG